MTVIHLTLAPLSCNTTIITSTMVVDLVILTNNSKIYLSYLLLFLCFANTFLSMSGIGSSLAYRKSLHTTSVL